MESHKPYRSDVEDDGDEVAWAILGVEGTSGGRGARVADMEWPEAYISGDGRGRSGERYNAVAGQDQHDNMLSEIAGRAEERRASDVGGRSRAILEERFLFN